MPEFKLNGKTYSGSTNYASAISYTEDDGSKTTIQNKINELAYRPVNNNILINSNFANPVNQRGITAETWNYNQYGLDRWVLWNNGAKCSAIDINGTSFYTDENITSAGALLSQAVEPNNIEFGKMYTLSVYIDNKIYSFSRVIENQSYFVYSISDGIALEIDARDTKCVYIGVRNRNSTPITIKWIKLELGEVATPYIPRLYWEEFQLCQKYFQSLLTIGSFVYAYSNTNVLYRVGFSRMRQIPTATVSWIGAIASSNGSGINANSSSILSTNNDYVEIKGTFPSAIFTNGSSSRISLTLDAEL